MLKHTGKIINTDARCVVLYMQIPGRDDHALVINMDTLPPHFERPIRALLESEEGQASNPFADILSRRLMPDTGVRILDALHNARLLIPVSIDQIIMTPRPSMAFPLRKVIALMKSDSNLPAQTDFAAEKFNPHTHNQKMRSVEDRVNLAKNILMEVEQLQRAAAEKVERAYTMAPELRPAVVPAYSVEDRLPVVEDSYEGPAAEVTEVELNDIHVSTETADEATIEQYADMMDKPLIERVPGRDKAKKSRK